jgi:serine/threonine protein kinase, bacterial
MPLAVGDVFAGYTVVRALGSGGMGEVYLVDHPRLPRRDALKVLPIELTADDEYRQRFNREADIVAHLWHPHIVGVHDRGETDGQLWLTMDYVEGSDAARLLQDQRGRGLPPGDVVRLVSAVADALDYAHERQLLHRDVKPSNILLSDIDSGRRRILLADFGIARWVDDSTGLTATDMAVGTVAYAAPEQLLGDAIDGRADQYALAATAFHLLTGQQPFQHTNPAVVISQHLTAPPPAIADRVPELSALGPVFSRALAKKPEDRYPSCLEFAYALTKNLNAASLEVEVSDATMPAPRARRATAATSRRSALRWVIVAAVVTALVGAAAAIGLLLRDRNGSGTPAQPPSAPPTTAVIPVVLIGADCGTLGAEGVSAAGQTAYCARLPATGDIMWSIYSGPVPSPSDTPGPNDHVYPPGIEEQVRVCVQQTGQSRTKCRDDVRQGNLIGPA